MNAVDKNDSKKEEEMGLTPFLSTMLDNKHNAKLFTRTLKNTVN